MNTSNPYRALESAEGNSSTGYPAEFLCHWNKHEIRVSAAMVPRFLPLLGQLQVSVDGSPAYTSSKVGMQEQVPFEFDHNGKTVSGTAGTYGFAVGTQRFRIKIDDERIADGAVSIKSGKLGFALGILIGMMLPLAFVDLMLTVIGPLSNLL